MKLSRVTTIWSLVTATDKDGQISVAESKRIFIEEPNYPDIVHCDIVAR